MPPKRKPDTRQKESKTQKRSSLTQSEQEIIDQLPPPGYLTRIDKAKEKAFPTYLIYVLLHTSLERPPQVIIRKTYESQFEALEGFRREYTTWLTGDAKHGPFPRGHTEQQLTPTYLFNIMEMNKKKDADQHEIMSEAKHRGRGKLEYAIIHRDDVELEDEDPRKRRCVIVCEETISEGM